TLAIIAQAHYRYNLETKKEKLAQYAERVWGIDVGTQEEKANKGIINMKQFYHSIGIDTKISDYVADYQDTDTRNTNELNNRYWMGIGEYKRITPQDAYEIVLRSC